MFTREQMKKLARSLLLSALGGGLGFFAYWLGNQDFGPWAPFAGAGAAFLANVARMLMFPPQE